LTNSKSYRLSRPDERDVRWGLSQDVKGDVGIRSTFSAFKHAMDLRANMRPVEWVQPKPGEPNPQQSIPCKGDDHRTLLTYEMSEELLDAAAEIRVVWGAFAMIGPHSLGILARVYRDRCPGGLEAFDDVAPLVVDTRAAKRCHAREVARNDGKRDPGIVGACMSLSRRIRSPQALEDDESKETDRVLWAEMFEAADGALSGACRAYTKAAARMRQARRVEQVATLARRNRAS
jgi:hypothetical protein